MALRHVPDWRWLLGRDDSPWYPSMRLFRQSEDGAWDGVFADIERALKAVMAGNPAAAPEIPVSWGELIDKLTILEIKSERLESPEALANVLREIRLISRLAQDVQKDIVVAALAEELRAVNSELWDIEDAIRRKEAAGAFDDEFIRLARSVYKRNDARAALKRKINLQLDSNIQEEKSYAAY